jgi:hypothetical protein
MLKTGIYSHFILTEISYRGILGTISSMIRSLERQFQAHLRGEGDPHGGAGAEEITERAGG